MSEDLLAPRPPFCLLMGLLSNYPEDFGARLEYRGISAGIFRSGVALILKACLGAGTRFMVQIQKPASFRAASASEQSVLGKKKGTKMCKNI